MFKSRIAGLLAATVAAFGLTSVTASSASASASAIEGPWKPWDNHWNTTCGQTTTHWLTTNAGFQACFIVDSGGVVQPVLVVKKNAAVAIRIKGSADSTYGTTVNCPATPLSAGQRTTCMGTTEALRPGNNDGWGNLSPWNNNAWYVGSTAVVRIIA
ncbi:hypothetical protein ABZ714_16705 [Streptomyces sp. NPDC006798]|uniref:hypothetical protein n=1 Tax=Streptomyces sp. NPDC006798 TaxID=3155462 RepID=UPI0033F7550C